MRSKDKTIRYQDHALARMEERGISKEQVEKTIRLHDRIRPARRPGAKRFEKKFSPKTTVKVIADETDREFWVVSAFK